MSEGLSQLEQRIDQFEKLLEEMKEATREAHGVLKQVRIEHREIERLLSHNAKQMVDDRVAHIVKEELAKIGPEIRKQSNLIYDKVGKQIDKIIDLSLGKEFSSVNGREDLRPELAEKLKVWLMEVIEEG
jgi:hypothetical protein